LSQTLGEALRQERESRGISIEQIASATKINVRLLHALEEDQYSELPAKPFVRGFVASYCRFIGLNLTEILSRYDSFIEEKATERPLKDSGHSGYVFERRDVEKGRTMLWLVMSIFLVMGALAIFVLKPALKHRRMAHVEKLKSGVVLEGTAQLTDESSADSNSETKENDSQALALNAKEQAKTQTSESSAEAPSFERGPDLVEEAKEELEDPDPLNKGDDLAPENVNHHVVFQALEDVWVRYVVDERQIMRFVLRKGLYLVLRAEESIYFQVSNRNSITYRDGAREFQPLTRLEEHFRQVVNTTTLIFPFPEDSSQRKTPFDALSPLPKTPAPPSEDLDSE
jgi:cytoskeletal protein RodZ